MGRASSIGLLNLMRRRRRRVWRNPWRKRTRWWVLPVYLAAIFVVHVAAMMVLEGLTLIEAVWLTATTIVTVGYGDLSAKTPEGRIATMLLMYVGAVFVVAIALNNWLDARAEAAERKAQGAWRWKLDDHIVIIGGPDRDATAFFARLARQIRRAHGWAETPVQLLTRCYEDAALPQALRDLAVVHYTGSGTTEADLTACDVARARGVVVLAASDTDPAADARTFDIVDRVRQAGYRGPVVAECVEDENRPRLFRVGATAVVRPMRGYPEMLTRALFAPGAEQVIENLFTAEGDECLLVELPQVWRARWADIVTTVVRENIGIPIACRDTGGEAAGEAGSGAEGGGIGRIRTNPPGDRTVAASALYVIVDDKVEARARARIPELAAAGAGADARPS